MLNPRLKAFPRRPNAATVNRAKVHPMRFIMPLLCLLVPLPVLAQPAPQAVPVGVVPAERQAINRGADFVGRIEAMQKVDIRARVTGFLQSVDFVEGTIVHEGDKLYQIEQDPFIASQLQTRGALLQAQAELTNATLQLARAEELVKTSATPVAVRDERRAAQQTAQGSVIRADADLRTATINLGYTTITTPITGKIGRTTYTKGNLVGPDSGVLATVVSEDPIYVTFPVSQRVFLQLEQEMVQKTRTAAAVRIQFADGSAYPDPARIDFIDVRVDRATDTVVVRATAPNPKGMLVDGSFVRVRVESETPEQRVVVPQAAVVLDQEGAYVFVVENGRAVVRRVTTGQQIGRNVVIDQGLQGGEQVVLDGITALRPNAPVTASPAKRV